MFSFFFPYFRNQQFKIKYPLTFINQHSMLTKSLNEMVHTSILLKLLSLSGCLSVYMRFLMLQDMELKLDTGVGGGLRD